MKNYILKSKKPSMVWIYTELTTDRIDAKYFDCIFLENEKRIKNNIKTKKLNKLCKIFRGNTPKQSDYEKDTNNFVIKGDNLTSLGLKYENIPTVSNEYFQRNKCNRLKFGSVLISSIGTGSTGKADILSKEGNYLTVAENTICEKNTSEIDMFYLVSYLRTKYGKLQLLRNEKGSSGQTHLYPSDLRNIEIPVVEYNIQKYIGDKVRKAEKLREEAKRLKKEAEDIVYKELNINSLENKFKSLDDKYIWVHSSDLEIRVDSKYYDKKVLMIKKYFNSHFDTIKLKDCLQYYTKGKSFVQNRKNGVVLIKTKNLNNLMINYEDNFVCEKEVDNNLILKEKDLIFASMGVGSLGKIDMYYPVKEKSTIDGTLILLRFKNDCKLKPEYVMEFIRTQIGQKLVYQNVVGSTGIISISVEDLLDIDIPFIDIEKQEKISNIVNKYLTNLYMSKQLIQEAKQDVEDLIEGNFDMSKVKANS